MFTKIFGIAQITRFVLHIVANVANFLVDQIDRVLWAVEHNDWGHGYYQPSHMA